MAIATRSQEEAFPMPRAIWTGTLSFGLVSIPIRMYNATTPRDVRFHQFDRETGGRVRYRRVVDQPTPWEAWPGPTAPPQEEPAMPAPDRPALELEHREVGALVPTERQGPTDVPWEDVVKGYEVAPGRYVTLTRDELESVWPERTRTIDLEDFVDLADIDPIFFDKSYYLAPQRGAEKPYALLLEAMRRAGKVGIARFVLRTKPYLAAIRPVEGAIVLETLFFADEVREVKEIDNLPVLADISEREVDMALRLIELLETTWDPGRYRDEYRERILELIREKAESEGALVEVPPGPEPGATKVPDLLAALRASVEAAREQRTEQEEPPAKRKRRRSG